MVSFRPIVGIEVHLELKTRSKMFCGCAADHFGKKPNSLCCPVCLGLPGSLPVPNKRAVEWTILLGLALNCQIPKESYFERKNYFYPDLPKGYQISQYHQPLAINGKLKLKMKNKQGLISNKFENEKLKIVRIQRVHLEEDTGKLLHREIKGKKCTLIDFNRAGVPLVEIVSEPDIHSSEEAKIYLQEIQRVVRYLDISDAQMEKGTMRCEPNVNVRILDQKKWIETPIVEIKNINSFKFVQKAIDYEVKRQIKNYQKTKIAKGVGNKTTRGFDEKKGVTYPQRQKEESFDYRYFPEPDIPPIRWSKSQISNLIRQLADQLSKIELPDQKVKRFIKKYGLTEYQAGILVANRKTADYFEEVTKHLPPITYYQLPITIANWIINKRVDISKIPPKKLARMIVQDSKKKVLPKKRLNEAIKKIISENKKAVADFKKGKQGVVEFLLGQVMRETKGQANPQEARKAILSLAKTHE